MENSDKKTIGFKSLWHKEADFFDACYSEAAKINNGDASKKSDRRDFIELSKEAREHCAQLRQIVLTNIKIATELGNNPEARRYYVDIEYEPKALDIKY